MCNFGCGGRCCLALRPPANAQVDLIKKVQLGPPEGQALQRGTELSDIGVSGAEIPAFAMLVGVNGDVCIPVELRHGRTARSAARAEWACAAVCTDARHL